MTQTDNCNLPFLARIDSTASSARWRLFLCVFRYSISMATPAKMVEL